jgi:hypothetical protein
VSVPVRITLCAAGILVAGGLALTAGQARAQAPDGTAHEHAQAHDHEHGEGHGSAHGHEHAVDGDQAEAHPHPAPGAAHEPAAGAGAADAALSPRPATPQAGEPATLAFTLTDAAGRPLEELITHHARQLHVVILSEDMAVLGHIHPQDFGEPVEGGEANVRFTFPRAGRYIVAADLITEAGPYAEQFLVEVAGEASGAGAGAAAPARVAVVQSQGGDRYTAPVMLDGADKADGYEVSLARPERIEAGQPATLTWRIAKGGAPVTDLRPFLDAALHLAVVRDDLGAFLHAHGSVAEEAAAGHAAQGAHEHAAAADRGHGGDVHASHGAHGHEGPASFGPELTATVTFPEPGRYYLFGQAAHGEKILIARFPVEVN